MPFNTGFMDIKPESMKSRILDIIDFAKVDALLDGFNASTGFVTAILDLEGNVLSKSGWRQICTEFHRINPETLKRCTISDTILAGKMAAGEKYHFYKCFNGLVDVAVPLTINGEHIANLFTGQFFLEEPDRLLFEKQAETYGFDKNDYLGALEKVPVVNAEKVKQVMDFLLNMTRLIVEMTLHKIEQKEQDKATRESEERFRKIFEEGPLGMVMAIMNTGRIFNANKAFCNMLGFTREELIGLTFMEITHANDRDKDRESVIDLQNGKINKYITEKRYLKKDGSEVWAALALTRIYSEKEQSFYALAMIEDITLRKLAQEEIFKLNAGLEIKVEERTAQLKAANKELETFTYSVSHDLKAPLRGIDGYSKLLSDIYKPNLNEEARKFIEIIRQSTLQMNQLIDDLLNYSRLERTQLSLERIKIHDLVRSVLSVFNADLENGKFTVNIKSPDIEIIADSRGLTIAIRNLIENAIKFTRARENPLIQIAVEEKDMLWIISVQDNGIGFDMKYHDKIFEIFQRLQRVEDFPGTGIGLAMVSKAMVKMNGQVHAESLPGKGSTFYLEIPKDQFYTL